ncbi:sigma 54-interacting transcriptional regulator [bacterium]|nr:sigma 54-interacting transcriptional regulator [bacterium]
MSKKTLAVVSYHSYSIEVYDIILKPLFSNYIRIEKYPLDARSIKKGIVADLVLLSSYTLFQEVKKHVLNDTEIIIADHTLMKHGIDQIKQFPNGTKAMLVNINYKVCVETILLIHQLGCRNLELIPVYPDSVPAIDINLAVTPGEVNLVPKKVSNIIDIGHRVFNISTIGDIAAKLDVREVLESDRYLEYSRSIAPPSLDLDNILGENQILNKQLDTLLKIVDKAIIIINASGIIHSYNASAERIVGYKKEIMIGENATKMMPEIPYREVLETGREIKQKLINMNSNTTAVTVSPIVIGGILYGAVAAIEEFTEIEKSQHKLRVQLIGKGHKARYTFEDILGASPDITNCKKIARRMAGSASSILLTGESGTGKELFAQAIHNESDRKEYQFVAVNCAALPESLLESELFGYVRGAFSGAKKEGKMGLFELAHKGTLFLDEIGEISPTIQVRLLRVLQERNFMRIGGDEVISVDVRIIAATNSNLEALVSKKRFRQDLYYRLRVLPLNIPPLRDRKEDILALVDEYKKKLNADFELSDEATRALVQNDWNGNIRELINCVEYLSNIEEKLILVRHLPVAPNSQPLKEKAKDKDDQVDKMLADNRYSASEYLFVLEILERAYANRERVGRRSLSKKSDELELFLTEQEIRGLIIKLQDYGMVIIKRGRGGTKITDLGRTALKRLKEMK